MALEIVPVADERGVRETLRFDITLPTRMATQVRLSLRRGE